MAVEATRISHMRMAEEEQRTEAKRVEEESRRALE